MVVKLGKVVYLITKHVHTTFEISSSFISQNIPIEMLFFIIKQPKIKIFLVCKILTNGAMGLKLGKVVYLIAQHIHIPHFKSLPHLFLKI